MSARTMTTMALASALCAVAAAPAMGTTKVECVVPDATNQQRISVTLMNFPLRPVDVTWEATAPGWATSGVRRVTDGSSTFELVVPNGTRVVDVATRWGSDPVRDSYRVSVDAYCPPLVPPPPPEPPKTNPPTPPVTPTPPAPPTKKPPAKRWTCKTLPAGAGRAWRVRLGCVRVVPPKKVKSCPPRYRIGSVVITRRTASGVIVIRRVYLCTPPAVPAPNPTG